MGILKAGKITVWTLVATFLAAGILLVSTLNSVSADNRNDHNDEDHNSHSQATATPSPTPTPKHDDRDDHDEHDDHDHKTASPTPTVRPTATASASPSVSPTAVPTDPGITVVYDGKGDGLGCAVHDCSGNTSSSSAIQGYGVGGQVLGASTMASTGSFDEMFYQAIMSIGGTLTAFGIRGLKKAKKTSKK